MLVGNICAFSVCQLDDYVIMPNHVHGIIVIDKSDDFVETQDIASLQQRHKTTKTQDVASLRRWNLNKFGTQSNNLGSIIRGFKIGVKKWATINDINFEWQPRFYDRIIRDEYELMNVRNYIRNNPLQWLQDEENPDFNK